MRSLRKRRGVTLVLVALLITVLTGLTAFGVDFSRMYAARAQLKVVTDAAALSAVTDLAKGVTDKSVADARALLLRRTNLVEQRTLTDDEMNGNDIVPVRWSRNAVAPFPVVAWRDANAVQVTARYTASWLLARIFGVTQKRLSATSVAALGSPWQSHCFKPWAIPYTNVLATLGRTPTDTSYRLTDADIALLRDNRVPIAFRSPVEPSMAAVGWSPRSRWVGIITRSDSRRSSMPMGPRGAHSLGARTTGRPSPIRRVP